MTRRALLVVALTALSTSVSCKRSIPEEPAPPPATARPSAGATSCPSIPEWAASPDTPEQLLAELVYVPETKDPDRKGTGMRIYLSGLVVAWDELDVKWVGGELKSERIPGAWRPEPARATKEQLKTLEDLIEALPDADIEGAQGQDKTSAKAPNFVHVRKAGAWKRGCYRGMTGNEAQSKIEAGIRTLVGAVKEAGKKAAPAGSAKKGP